MALVEQILLCEKYTGGSHQGSLYISREEIPSIGRLEAQLKACLCRLVFSKAKVRICSQVTISQHSDVTFGVLGLISLLVFLPQPSVLALSLVAQEFEVLQSVAMLKIVQQLQRHLKVL